MAILTTYNEEILSENLGRISKKAFNYFIVPNFMNHLHNLINVPICTQFFSSQNCVSQPSCIQISPIT